MAAENFAKIIIIQDKDVKGASSDYINQISREVIDTVDSAKKKFYIPEGMPVIAHASENACRGYPINKLLVGVIEAIKLVENFRSIQGRRDLTVYN